MSQPNLGGAPEGNRNAAKAKRWQQALERGLARFANGTVDDGLDKVADWVVKAAAGGDKDAWSEIGNRIDGKPSQSVEVDGRIGLSHSLAGIIGSIGASAGDDKAVAP